MILMLKQEMCNGLPMVRRRTLVLERQIRESAARGAASTRTRAILVAQPGQPTWPARVLRDPILGPVDKIVWMVLRQNAARGRFPSYAQIGRAANVSSKSTVSRALAILRVARWLARCEENGTHGANHGATGGATCGATRGATRGASVEVYTLHEEPLPLPDALHLDAGYLAFLQFAQAHSHARVRKVVRYILTSLEGTVHERTFLSSIAR